MFQTEGKGSESDASLMYSKVTGSIVGEKSVRELIED